ncbi:hypothetical protein [Phaeocystidibacter marisrubri]|uniref:DUF4625 domain-containing protein n=1 Tax=Phaeocystidibacter marisrubri TaxID=1577780 RepID=A0A6L3ZHH6_9FLAO|nr:hypothetical protein [Phaeocystidibacter marisrubri]KAB2817321.1 hypothetical protein F8C82_02715 [Phaeocystidibacter marisrubri]GGH75926.1 hypothetical protein GCM10011318_23460 [Phaeocystidibacter marisrubri]
MKFNFATLFLLSGLISLNSCEVDDPKPASPSETAKITFDEPSTGDTYMLNDTVFVRGAIEYPDGLHGYRVVITNLTTDSVVFSTDVHAHDALIYFDEYWVNHVADHSDMKVRVTAAFSHTGEMQSDSVLFHCHPM